jgi:hypothetical protein
MNHDQMMQAQQYIPNVCQTLRNRPHIYTRHLNKLHMLRMNHIKLHTHVCLKYPYYLNNPITVPTHPKQQQAKHQPKQQTSQKQKKALTVMTMMTRYPSKKSAEEARKEQAPEPQKCHQ